MVDFKTKLGRLASLEKITEEEYQNFLRRGMQYEKFDADFPILREIFPDGVPIGASETFIENLDFPYQETSYVCSPKSRAEPKTYLYKTNDREGITNLLGGKRPIGDSLFASLNRILLGSDAVIISADNLIANSSQVWDWEFFGQYIKEKNPSMYEELKKFNRKRSSSRGTQVILARKQNTFERLDFLKKYNQGEISIFDSDNNVVILTNQEGFEYASKVIKPDSQIQYIVETNNDGNIDIKRCMKTLRKKLGVKKILNDGGREMSNGIRELDMLGGERISYEPYPGDEFIPTNITHDMIIGSDGLGIDDSPLPKSVVAFSQEIFLDQKEVLTLHMYPM